MSVLDRLASALGRNDERPNVALAHELAEKPDMAAIKELVGALQSGTTAQQNDAIKVLYELAEQRPELFGPADLDAFLATLTSRNNRLLWGGMTALAAAAVTQHKALARSVPEIVAAADRGSVIAKDQAIRLLCTLARSGHSEVLPVLLARLEDAAPNQFPTYAEEILAVSDASSRPKLAAIIEQRMPQVAGEAKQKRLAKVLRELAK
jgi:hypothetical protein